MEDAQKLQVLYAKNCIKFPQSINKLWMIFGGDKLMSMIVHLVRIHYRMPVFLFDLHF
jgi:hypothetical protein